MAKFIKLTNNYGSLAVFVNCGSITYIEVTSYGARISFCGDDCIEVKQTPEEILKLIESENE